MLQSMPSYRFISIPVRVLLAVLLIASGPSVQVGKVSAVNFSMFGYLSTLAFPTILRSVTVDALLKESHEFDSFDLHEHSLHDPSIMEFWDENSGIVDFDDSITDDLLDDLSATTLTYDEVHISVDEMSVLNDLHWRSIESSQRVDIAWDLIAEGCARYLMQAGTMPTSWTEYLGNELAKKRMYAPHFVVGRRPSLIKLCLIILPPPDVPNIISGGVVPFGGYPTNNRNNQDGRNYHAQRNDYRNGGGEGLGSGQLNVDHEIVSAVSKIVELSWYPYDESESLELGDIPKKKQEKTKEKKDKKKKGKKMKKKKGGSSPFSDIGHEMISYDGEGGGGVIGDAIEELLLRNIQEWLFVEEQLLDPTVVVDTPEILLPLQHLTSSLEMIAHYYLMRGLKHRAIETLERACPLMELIPIEVESDQHRACFELLTSIYFNRFEENNIIETMPKPSPLSWHGHGGQPIEGQNSKLSSLPVSNRGAPTLTSYPPIEVSEETNTDSKLLHQPPSQKDESKDHVLKDKKQSVTGLNSRNNFDDSLDEDKDSKMSYVSTSKVSERLESIRVPFEHLRKKISFTSSLSPTDSPIMGVPFDQDMGGGRYPFSEMNIDEITNAFALYSSNAPSPDSPSSTLSFEEELSSEALKRLPSSMSHSDYDNLLVQMAEREHVHQEKVKSKKFLSELQLKHRNEQTSNGKSRLNEPSSSSQQEEASEEDGGERQGRSSALRTSRLLKQPSSEFDLLAVKFVKALLADGPGPVFPSDYFMQDEEATAAVSEKIRNSFEQDDQEGAGVTSDALQQLSSLSLSKRKSALESASIILRLAEETVEKLAQTETGEERCRARMCGEYLLLMRKLLEAEELSVASSSIEVKKSTPSANFEHVAENEEKRKCYLREQTLREVHSLQPKLHKYHLSSSSQKSLLGEAQELVIESSYPVQQDNTNIHFELFSTRRPSVIVANDEVEVLKKLKTLEMDMMNSTTKLKNVQSIKSSHAVNESKSSNNNTISTKARDIVSEIEGRIKIAQMFVQAVSAAQSSKLYLKGKKPRKKRSHVLSSIIHEHEEMLNHFKFNQFDEEGNMYSSDDQEDGWYDSFDVNGRDHDEDTDDNDGDGNNYATNTVDYGQHVSDGSEMPFISTFDRPRNSGFFTARYRDVCLSLGLDPIHGCHFPQLMKTLKNKMISKLFNPFSKELKLRKSSPLLKAGGNEDDEGKSLSLDDDYDEGLSYVEFLIYFFLLWIWRFVAAFLTVEFFSLSCQFCWFFTIGTLAGVFLSMRRDFVQAMQPNNVEGASLPTSSSSNTSPTKKKNAEKRGRKGGNSASSTALHSSISAAATSATKDGTTFNENEFNLFGYDINGTTFGLREDWSFPSFYWIVWFFYCKLCVHFKCEHLIPEFTLSDKMRVIFASLLPSDKSNTNPISNTVLESESFITEKLPSTRSTSTTIGKVSKSPPPPQSRQRHSSSNISKTMLPPTSIQNSRQSSEEEKDSENETDDSDEDLSNLVKSISKRAKSTGTKQKASKMNKIKSNPPSVPAPAVSEFASKKSTGVVSSYQATSEESNRMKSSFSSFTPPVVSGSNKSNALDSDISSATIKSSGWQQPNSVDVHDDAAILGVSKQTKQPVKSANNDVNFGALNSRKGQQQQQYAQQSTNSYSSMKRIPGGKGVHTVSSRVSGSNSSRSLLDEVPPRESYSGGWTTNPVMDVSQVESHQASSIDKEQPSSSSSSQSHSDGRAMASGTPLSDSNVHATTAKVTASALSPSLLSSLSDHQPSSSIMQALNGGSSSMSGKDSLTMASPSELLSLRSPSSTVNIHPHQQPPSSNNMTISSRASSGESATQFSLAHQVRVPSNGGGEDLDLWSDLESAINDKTFTSNGNNSLSPFSTSMRGGDTSSNQPVSVSTSYMSAPSSVKSSPRLSYSSSPLRVGMQEDRNNSSFTHLNLNSSVGIVNDGESSSMGMSLTSSPSLTSVQHSNEFGLPFDTIGGLFSTPHSSNFLQPEDITSPPGFNASPKSTQPSSSSTNRGLPPGLLLNPTSDDMDDLNMSGNSNGGGGASFLNVMDDADLDLNEVLTSSNPLDDIGSILPSTGQTRRSRRNFVLDSGNDAEDDKW